MDPTATMMTAVDVGGYGSGVLMIASGQFVKKAVKYQDKEREEDAGIDLDLGYGLRLMDIPPIILPNIRSRLCLISR